MYPFGKMKGNTEIKGERVILRPITENDTDNIIKWRNSKEVRQFFIYQPLFDVLTHSKWLKEVVEPGAAEQFIICSRQEGKDVGSVYLKGIDGVNKTAELGIFIGETNFEGRGLGTECIKLMVDFGYNTLGLNSIYARILGENIRSQRAFDKACFVPELYSCRGLEINGVLHDLIIVRNKNIF